MACGKCLVSWKGFVLNVKILHVFSWPVMCNFRLELKYVRISEFIKIVENSWVLSKSLFANSTCWSSFLTNKVKNYFLFFWQVELKFIHPSNYTWIPFIFSIQLESLYIDIHLTLWISFSWKSHENALKNPWMHF